MRSVRSRPPKPHSCYLQRSSGSPLQQICDARGHVTSSYRSRRQLSGEGVRDPVDNIGRTADHEEVAPFRSGPQRQPVRLREPSRRIVDAYRPLRGWEAYIGLVDVDPAPLSIVVREERCRETAEIHIPARSQGQTGPRDFRSRAARRGIRSACTLIRRHRGLDRRRKVGAGEELTDPNYAKEQAQDRGERMPHTNRTILLDEAPSLEDLHEG